VFKEKDELVENLEPESESECNKLLGLYPQVDPSFHSAIGFAGDPMNS